MKRMTTRRSLCHMALATMLLALAWGAGMAQAGGIPVYGKWCGPGHGFKAPPIDAVDRLCMGHDICVQKSISQHKVKKAVHGLQFCYCDRPIITGMSAALRQTKSAKAQRAGKLIHTYFKNTACLCSKRICLTVPKCTKVKKCKKVLGKQRCTKVPKCKKVKMCKTTIVMGRGGKCPSGAH